MQFIPNAPLRSQCSEDYFYSTDPWFEEYLQGIEGRSESYFKAICATDTIPDDLAHRDIAASINIMRGRTRLVADQAWAPVEATLKEGYRLHSKIELEKEVPEEWMSSFRIEDKAAARRSVIHAITSSYLLRDLGLKLLKAPAGERFITSDNPAVVLNQAFFHVIAGSEVSGLAMRGIQLFLPLDPSRCLLAFDRDCYRVGRPDRDVVQIQRNEDVGLINALQILNAEECLYFIDKADEQSVRKLLHHFNERRRRLTASSEQMQFPAAPGQISALIVAKMPRIPVPGLWSFCKLRRKFSAKDFGERDPRFCQIYEEYRKDAVYNDRLIPLSEWIKEQEAKGWSF
jgi:hypothetical protein